MISYLHGQVLEVNDKSLTLNVSGVGYELHMPLSSLLKIKPEEELSLYVHTHVREDQLSLFGFDNIKERDLFRKLISVSGIGPRSALTMLSVATTSTIIRSIESGSAESFPRVPGVGKKTLEKLILELRGKLDITDLGEENDATKNAKLALESLGYNARDIATVMSSLNANLSMNDLIRESLKLLSKA